MAEFADVYKNIQQPDPMGALAKVIGIVGGINQNNLFQQTFKARENVGEAYKRNTNPDGTLNEEGLRRDLGNSGFGAGEALSQGIANTTANFNLNKARNDYIVNTLGAATNDPKLTGRSAVGTLLTLGKNAGIPAQMMHPLIKDIYNDPNPESVRAKLSQFQNQALGTHGATRVTGAPDAETKAPTTVPLASQTGKGVIVGLPTAAQELELAKQAEQVRDFDLKNAQANELRTIAGSMYNTNATPDQVRAAVLLRSGQAGYKPEVVQNYLKTIQSVPPKEFGNFLKNERTQASGTGGLFQTQTVYPPVGGQPYSVPTANVPAAGVGAGQAPGYTETATGPGGAGGINNMVSMANDAPNQHALLQNLNDLSNEAVTGPTSDFEKKANALSLRLFGKGITMTPQQLASSEEYGKISDQLAGQQAAAAHATDAYLRNAYSTNPGLYLSKIGRQGITHMLQGNVDSIVAKNDAWTSYANGEVDGRMHSPAEFSSWNKSFNKDFNPRVFQYARMTGDERAKFRENMSVADQKKLASQIQKYSDAGWINLGQ